MQNGKIKIGLHEAHVIQHAGITLLHSLMAVAHTVYPLIGFDERFLNVSDVSFIFLRLFSRLCSAGSARRRRRQ